MSVAEPAAPSAEQTPQAHRASAVEGTRDAEGLRAGPLGALAKVTSSLRLLGSELELIMGRRRNQAGLAVLAAVPVLMAVAVWRSQSAAGGPTFLDSVLSNGLFVPFAALTVEITMFLPLAMSMLSGDAIAGEANLGTLRYLLTVPVSRTRLVVIKLLSLSLGAALGVGVIAVTGALVGIAIFGTGPMVTLSGSQIGTGQGAWRLLIACAYLTAGLTGLAAVGLFISTLTEQPIAASIALMIFTIVSWIVEGISQLGWLHPWLLVHHWMAFIDVMRDPIATEAMAAGLRVDLAYVLVFGAAAWAVLWGKDITS